MESRLLIILFSVLGFVSIQAQDWDHFEYHDMISETGSYVRSIYPTGNELIYSLENRSALSTVNQERVKESLSVSCFVVDAKFILKENGDWSYYFLNGICDDVVSPLITTIESFGGEIVTQYRGLSNDGFQGFELFDDNNAYVFYPGLVLAIDLDVNTDLGSVAWEQEGDIVSTITNENGVVFLFNDLGSVYKMEDGLEAPVYHDDLGFVPKKVFAIDDVMVFVTNDFVRVTDLEITTVLLDVVTPNGGLLIDAFADEDNLYFIEENIEDYKVYAYSDEQEYILLHEESCENVELNSISVGEDHVFIGGKPSYLKSLKKEADFSNVPPRPEITVNYFDAYLAEEVEGDGGYRKYEWQVDFTSNVEINDLVIRFNGDQEYNCAEKLVLQDVSLAAQAVHSFTGSKTIENWDGFCNERPENLLILGANKLPLCEAISIEVDATMSSLYEAGKLIAPIQIFPNPVNEFLQVENALENLPFLICDLSGRVLKQEIFSDAQLDVSDLQSGVYLFKQGPQAKRFIKY